MSSTPSESAARLAAHILVVDDEPDLRTLYELTLLREGYRVDTAATVSDAWRRLEAQRFDTVITDMRLPDGLGLEILQRIQQQQRPERCVVMTAYGSAENAVEALKAGAFDYLTKPVDLKQFRSVVASAVREGTQLPAPSAMPSVAPEAASVPPPSMPTVDVPGRQALERLVGHSEPMQRVKARIVKVARGMAPVLVHGESGTGKELVARAVHACSQRGDGPFVAVNCGAIPENLLEAEFFGARKGSYTGSAQDRDGYFQAARGGTLFLDEIGDLPLAMQSKLLRAIQERMVRPIGATQEESVDVRIVSATHKDLQAEVQAGRFRQDLFYRLNVIELMLPALRERREDLPALCAALLARIAQEGGLPTPALSAPFLKSLAAQPLHGNVRELENLLHRAMALSDGHELHLDLDSNPAVAGDPVPARSALDASAASREETPATPVAPSPAASVLPADLPSYLDSTERDILTRALQGTGFDRSAAASRLGLSPRQLRSRMQRLGIEMPTVGDA